MKYPIRFAAIEVDSLLKRSAAAVMIGSAGTALTHAGVANANSRIGNATLAIMTALKSLLAFAAEGAEKHLYTSVQRDSSLWWRTIYQR